MFDRRRDLIVVDDFFAFPDKIRQVALSSRFEAEDQNSYFERTASYFPPGIVDVLQSFVGCKIKQDENWQFPRTVDGQNQKTYNGTFYRVASGKVPPGHVHHDNHNYTGIVYLSPDCPPENGTMFFQHLATNARATTYPIATEGDALMRKDGNDFTKWACTDFVGNIYNRLVLFPSTRYHAARISHSTSLDRLSQIFLFNVERPDPTIDA